MVLLYVRFPLTTDLTNSSSKKRGQLVNTALQEVRNQEAEMFNFIDTEMKARP